MPQARRDTQDRLLSRCNDFFPPRQRAVRYNPRLIRLNVAQGEGRRERERERARRQEKEKERERERGRGGGSHEGVAARYGTAAPQPSPSPRPPCRRMKEAQTHRAVK